MLAAPPCTSSCHLSAPLSCSVLTKSPHDVSCNSSERGKHLQCQLQFPQFFRSGIHLLLKVHFRDEGTCQMLMIKYCKPPSLTQFRRDGFCTWLSMSARDLVCLPEMCLIPYHSWKRVMASGCTCCAPFLYSLSTYLMLMRNLKPSGEFTKSLIK